VLGRAASKRPTHLQSRRLEVLSNGGVRREGSKSTESSKVRSELKLTSRTLAIICGRVKDKRREETSHRHGKPQHAQGIAIVSEHNFPDNKEGILHFQTCNGSLKGSSTKGKFPGHKGKLNRQK